jgi:hypothetical protein
MRKLTAHFILLFFLLIAKPAWAEVWLRCVSENSKLFPDHEMSPPLIEVDGTEGRLRQGSADILELECIRSRDDPGLVTCHGLSQGRTGVVLANFFTVATDQAPPVALHSTAIILGTEVISPPAASRIALDCDINGMPSYPDISPVPRASNPNPTWYVE